MKPADIVFVLQLAEIGPPAKGSKTIGVQ